MPNHWPGNTYSNDWVYFLFKMDKEINEAFRIIPLFYQLHSDNTFDDSYVFKGATLIFSLILLPLTLPLYLIGRYFKWTGLNKYSKSGDGVLQFIG